MKNKFKTHAPILSIVLSMLAVGYTFANTVVVIPLGADEPPSGMVSAFNSETCPTGWEKYANAKGRFVVGLNDGGSLSYQRGGALEDRGSNNHNHAWGAWYDSSNTWKSYDYYGTQVTASDRRDGVGSDGAGVYPFVPSNPNLFYRYYTSNGIHTPPYVQLLYCEKV